MLFNNTLHPFGLDIGDKSIKIIQLSQQKKFKGGSRLILDAFGETKIPQGIIQNGEIKNFEKLSYYINELLKKNDIKSRSVIVSLPEKKSFLKLLKIEALNEENLKIILPKIIENNFPVSYQEIYSDWQIISRSVKKDEIFEYNVLIAAAFRKTVDSITTLMEFLGLTPISAEIEGVAIARCVLMSAPKTKNENKAIIDIGATCSNLIFIENHIPIISLTLPISGDAMTMAISKSLKLPIIEAEKTKIKCGLDVKTCGKQLRPILSFIINDTVKKIKDGLNFCNTSTSKNKISEIYLSGGGANLNKLDSVLSQKLRIKVRKCNPIQGIEIKNSILNKNTAKYTTAIGLALRGIISYIP